MLEHHDAGQDDRTRVDHVLVRVFRRRSMGRLEHGVAGLVVDVRPGGDADAADLRREGVGQVVAVEVQGGDDVELRGTGEHLLQHDVRDGVLDDDLPGRHGFLLRRVRRLFAFFLLDAVILGPGEGDVAELLLGQFVPPVFERAFGELHDVALVHQRHRLALVPDGVLDGRPDEALGAFLRYRFDADAGGFREADFVYAHFLLQEFNDLADFRRAGRPFDARVDVFRVFA